MMDQDGLHMILELVIYFNSGTVQFQQNIQIGPLLSTTETDIMVKHV